MEEFREAIARAKIGQIVPVYKVVEAPKEPVEYFAKLSDYGRKKSSFLLESADIVERYGELSIGTSNPCLRILGNKETFQIEALNSLGKKILSFIKNDFKFCNKVRYRQEAITGLLIPARRAVSEQQRLKLKTHMDIIRTVAFKFKPTNKPAVPYAGLFGAISYDFIDQFEDLPANKEDVLQDPDYELYFIDNLFIIDHKNGTMMLIANGLVMDNKRDELFKQCLKTIDHYESALEKKLPKAKKFKQKKQELATDTTKDEFIGSVERLKRHIVDGDILQAVPSRTIISNYNAEPLTIYSRLKELNPSPYMFFFNNKNGILLGSSPEMCLRVQGDSEKVVEIRPIAGTKPRGFVNDKIDQDLDSRYETELKIDRKELAEHAMLIDLARNDVAKVCKAGTRYCAEPFIVEKYSHVQHLVSSVKGVLKEELDALHAYLSSMNMGTLTGAPKIEAMKLIRQVEKTKRGFYGGSVCYITPHGDFDSCIVIRSMRLKANKAYVRAGAGIVYDSMPLNEFKETERKAQACLKAIQLAGGLK